METRNIIAAISLSAAVIILYTLFFAPPPLTQENLIEKNKAEQNSDAPSLIQKEDITEISREQALSENERVKFENQSIIGSISLKGAAIDDLTFKEYNIVLNGDEKVNLLAPRNSKEGYLIESGFISTDKNVKIPNSNSVWTVSGNTKLTSDSPIKLTWINDQGITFEKVISLDEKFLFTIKQRITNPTKNKYDFIVAGEILEHLDKPLSFLIKILTLLSENGIAFISTCINCPAIDHIVHFKSIDEVRNFLKESNLLIIDERIHPVEDLEMKEIIEQKITINYSVIVKNNS